MPPSLTHRTRAMTATPGALLLTPKQTTPPSTPPRVPGPAVPHWGVNPRLQYSGGLSVLYIFSFSLGSSVSANSVGISFMGADSLSFHSAVTVLSAAAAQRHTGYWRGQKYTPDVSALLQGVMG